MLQLRPVLCMLAAALCAAPVRAQLLSETMTDLSDDDTEPEDTFVFVARQEDVPVQDQEPAVGVSRVSYECPICLDEKVEEDPAKVVHCEQCK